MIDNSRVHTMAILVGVKGRVLTLELVRVNMVRSDWGPVVRAPPLPEITPSKTGSVEGRLNLIEASWSE